MKRLTGTVLLFVSFLLTRPCTAQFYYKDLLVSVQGASRWKLEKENKVRTVTLSSFEKDEQPSEGFECDQQLTSDFSRITTHTRSVGTPESWLIATYTSTGLP